MTHIIEQTAPCKARDTDDPAADRDFVIASIRTARTRLQLLSCELDEIGIALSRDMLPLERAVTWLHDIDVLQLVNPDVWREPPSHAAGPA
jgi:hypothetical protein